MEEFATGLAIEGVEVLVLEGNPFSIKHHILCGENQPERGYVIYSKCPKPANEHNWLLDFQEEGVIFAADMASIYAAECNIPLELKSSVVEAHYDFFKQAKNRNKCVKLIRSGMGKKEIIDVLLTVTTGCATPSFTQITYVLATECANKKDDIITRLKKYNLDGYYWSMIKEAFDYDKAQDIKSLLVVLFQGELNSALNHGRLTNEAQIFMREWRDSRQYAELYKQWAEQLETELNVMEQIKGESLENLVRIETFPCVDKVIALHLEREVCNGTITTERLRRLSIAAAISSSPILLNIQYWLYSKQDDCSKRLKQRCVDYILTQLKKVSMSM